MFGIGNNILPRYIVGNYPLGQEIQLSEWEHSVFAYFLPYIRSGKNLESDSRNCQSRK